MKYAHTPGFLYALLFWAVCSQCSIRHAAAQQADSTAQTSSTENYLLFGAGYSYAQGRDYSVSPLRYSGHSAVFYTGFHSYSDTKIHKLDIHASAGIVKPGLSDVMNSSMWLYHIQTDESLVFHISPVTAKWPLDFYLGGNLHTNNTWKYHRQYSNNFLNYDIVIDLGITSALRSEFSLFQHQWHAGFRLALPLLAGYVRPGFSSSFPNEMLVAESRLKGALQSINIASLGTYQRLQTQFSLNYFLHNGNSLMLAYRWDYYHIESVNASKQAFHTLSLSTNFNLN